MTTHTDTSKNINQWIDALESDIYQQATSSLRYGDAMCCLGVLCHISGISEWTDEKYLGEVADLPNEVVEWVGLSSPKGKFYITPAWILSLPEHIKNKLELIINRENNSYTYLSTLNDNGWTFKEIAELIRYNPPLLFNNDITFQY